MSMTTDWDKILIILLLVPFLVTNNRLLALPFALLPPSARDLQVVMKKLFNRDKVRVTKVTPLSRDSTVGIAANGFDSEPYHSLAPRQPYTPLTAGDSQRSSVDGHWQVVSDSSTIEDTPTRIPLPPGASPPMNNTLAPRSPSPYSSAGSGGPKEFHRERDIPIVRQRSSPPVNSIAALGILSSLEPKPNLQVKPHIDDLHEYHVLPETSIKEKEKKKGFGVWSARDKGREHRERDRERERDRDMDRPREKEVTESDIPELTVMIGYYLSSGVEDWDFALEICKAASVSEVYAKEAVTALRKQLKHGDPTIQLATARLWTIMLRNCHEVFNLQSMSRKFLDTLEEVITSPRSSPVVRGRMLEFLAAAAYDQQGNGPRNDKDGFRGLWRKLKHANQPEEGLPLDFSDTVLPSLSKGPIPLLDVASSEALEQGPRVDSDRNRNSSTKNRIIPVEEDMRRLFQECKIAEGNAALLSSALAYAKPEDLRKEITQEFYGKCRSSQDLIIAQIPWATAGAERSRVERSRKRSDHVTPPGESVKLTIEEQLLAALLGANERIQEAFRVYSELERLLTEHEVEERSRKEVRMTRKREIERDGQGSQVSNRSSSRSPLRSSPQRVARTQPDSAPHLPLPGRTDAPPTGDGGQASPQHPQSATSQSIHLSPPAPLGPRSAAPSITSRTPSPDSAMLKASLASSETLASDPPDGPLSAEGGDGEPQEESVAHTKPSAKALGKRKVIDEAGSGISVDETSESLCDSPNADARRDAGTPGTPVWKHPVHYVYDAAAERTDQRIKTGRTPTVVSDAR